MSQLASIPAAPLVRAIRRKAVAKGYIGSGGIEGLATFCEVTFGNRDMAESLVRRGMITPDAADRGACQLGLHPYEIWGEDWLVPFPDDDAKADHRDAQIVRDRARKHRCRDRSRAVA